MQYINRISALEEDKIYQLNQEGIVSVDGTILYRDVTAIHLKYAPSRYYTNIYKCIIKTSTKTIILSNRKYIKMATFEYHSDKYIDFLKCLHQHIESGSVKLHSGIKAPRYWLEISFALLFFSVLLGVLFLFGAALIAGGFALILLFRLGPYYMKNFPQKYSPDILPKSLLPKS